MTRRMIAHNMLEWVTLLNLLVSCLLQYDYASYKRNLDVLKYVYVCLHITCVSALASISVIVFTCIYLGEGKGGTFISFCVSELLLFVIVVPS